MSARGGLLALLAAGALLVVAPARADDAAPRRWGLGWDGQWHGLMLRHRFGADWEAGLAAGPNDSKHDQTVLTTTGGGYESNHEGLNEYALKRESGWVRATAGRRFWRQGRLALAGDAGVGFSWSNEQELSREPSFSDFDNRRTNRRTDNWWVTVALRPVLAVSTRVTLEAECGLEFSSITTRTDEYHWSDFDPLTSQESRHDHWNSFSSFGLGDGNWWEFKLVFWL